MAEIIIMSGSEDKKIHVFPMKKAKSFSYGEWIHHKNLTDTKLVTLDEKKKKNGTKKNKISSEKLLSTKNKYTCIILFFSQSTSGLYGKNVATGIAAESQLLKSFSISPESIPQNLTLLSMEVVTT